MIVVADASPLRYLVLLELSELLPRLYGRVLCSETVLAECRHHSAPAPVRVWAERPPEWLVVSVGPFDDDAPFPFLDPGERATIALALREKADAVLIDEALGRKAARSVGLVVVGVIGILGEAARRGWLDYDDAVTRVRRDTNFRVSEDVIDLGRRYASDGADEARK